MARLNMDDRQRLPVGWRRLIEFNATAPIGDDVKLEPSELKVRLDHTEDCGPSVHFDIEGIGWYGFTLANIPEEHRDWLVGVVTNQIEEIHRRSFIRGQQSVRKSVRRALDL